VLLLRSPFRVPIGERSFRLVWLGPIGRAFVRFGARSAAHATEGNSTPTPAGYTLPSAGPRMASVAEPPPSTPTLASLDARVAALESWHRDREKP
jgi:hypothetical protein